MLCVCERLSGQRPRQHSVGAWSCKRQAMRNADARERVASRVCERRQSREEVCVVRRVCAEMGMWKLESAKQGMKQGGSMGPRAVRVLTGI